MAEGAAKGFGAAEICGVIPQAVGGKDALIRMQAPRRADQTGLAVNGQRIIFAVESGRDGRESATDQGLA